MTKAFKGAWASAGAQATETGKKDTEAKHVTDRQNIAANPLNSRNINPASDDIRKLGESLAETQLHAIPVVPVAEFLSFEGYRALYADSLAQLAYVDGAGREHQVEYVAIGGGRRLAAAAVRDIARLEISIKKGLTREAFLRLTVVENLERAGLRPLEEAAQIQLLRDATGDSYAVLGEKLGRTKGFVAQRLDLLNLSPDLQSEIDSGDLGVTTARELLRRIKEELGVNAADDATVPAKRQHVILAEIRAGTATAASVAEPAAFTAVNAPETTPAVAVDQAPLAPDAAAPSSGPVTRAEPTPPTEPFTTVNAPPTAPRRKAGRPTTPDDEKIAAALKGKPRAAIVAALIRHFPGTDRAALDAVLLEEA